MTDEYEILVEMYDRLESYREKRRRLLQYALGFITALAVALPTMVLVRRLGLIFYVLLFSGLILAVVSGLLLLAAYIRNEVEARELEREVEDFKLAVTLGVKPKRKRRHSLNPKVHYIVGDDGELVPADEDKETERHS
jgi:uncharacterized protein (DUF58 family)